MWIRSSLCNLPRGGLPRRWVSEDSRCNAGIQSVAQQGYRSGDDACSPINQCVLRPCRPFPAAGRRSRIYGVPGTVFGSRQLSCFPVLYDPELPGILPGGIPERREADFQLSRFSRKRFTAVLEGRCNDFGIEKESDAFFLFTINCWNDAALAHMTLTKVGTTLATFRTWRSGRFVRSATQSGMQAGRTGVENCLLICMSTSGLFQGTAKCP